MTQEDKKLLLKDLCARLPYMPKIRIIYQQQGIKGTDEGNVSCDAIEHVVNDLRNGIITDIRIYLRSMSSMTEEDNLSLSKHIGCSIRAKYGEIYFPNIEDNTLGKWDKIFDWLNKYHFDYRGLIKKGLAIEVTKENNPYK